jgi:uncharacterized protein YqgC (DUF456 family)
MPAPHSHRNTYTCHTEVVPEYCTCGAKLPPDARFCHKCAKPQYDYPGLEDAQPPSTPPPLPVPPLLPMAPPAAEISFRNRTAVKIGLLAALLAFGANLLVTPIIQSPIVVMAATFGAGVIAPQWYRRRTGQQLSVRSGARIGWITGIFCFALSLLLLAIFFLFLANANSIQALRDNPTMQKAVEEWMKTLSDPAKAAESIIVAVVIMFLFVTTLPMLGGALGARLSDKRP